MYIRVNIYYSIVWGGGRKEKQLLKGRGIHTTLGVAEYAGTHVIVHDLSKHDIQLTRQDINCTTMFIALV